MVPASRPAGQSVDSQFSWLLGAIWLVWLINPALAVWQHAHWWGITVGLLVLLVFAVIYTKSWQLLPRWGGIVEWRESPPTMRGRLLVLGLMGLCMLALMPLCGAYSLSILPYLCAYATMALPLWWVVGVFLMSVAGVVWTASAVHETWPYYFLIGIVGVMVALGINRWLDLRRNQEQRELDLVNLAAERDRVATELHDTLGQSLTLISVKLALTEKLLERDPHQARHEVVECAQLTRQALADVRATVMGLRAARLEDEVAGALEALRSVGIEASFPDPAADIEPQNRITFAWALRELVTNVIRHSKASNVEVRWGPRWLEVVDDGVGLGSRRAGQGLTGLRERVEGLNGTLIVGPVSEGDRPGTRARVEL